MTREICKKDDTMFAAAGVYDSHYVTKLVDNYLSHSSILELLNNMFYDGELQTTAPLTVSHAFATWEHLI